MTRSRAVGRLYLVAAVLLFGSHGLAHVQPEADLALVLAVDADEAELQRQDYVEAFNSHDFTIAGQT